MTTHEGSMGQVRRGYQIPGPGVTLVVITSVGTGNQHTFSVKTVNAIHRRAVFLGPELVYF